LATQCADPFVDWWNLPAGQVPAVIAASTLEVAQDFGELVIVAHAVRYYQRERERERTEAALRVQLSETQLEALKAQLHPHFLFNTLNSVALLMHWDVAAADEMVTQLSDLLRETLRHPGTHEITLAEELSLIERYLSIVRARFQDGLSVVYDIAPDVRTALVPHFVLQPLVENALEPRCRGQLRAPARQWPRAFRERYNESLYHQARPGSFHPRASVGDREPQSRAEARTARTRRVYPDDARWLARDIEPIAQRTAPRLAQGPALGRARR
jgi:Histidine kinase